MPCNNCAFLIARGHDNTLCSLAGRPNTPQRRDTFQHRMFTDNELIRKKDIFDPIADDDEIDWKYNPFDVDTIDEVIETPEQLMSQFTFEGSTQLQTKLKALMYSLLRFVATVEPMKIVVDEDKWRLPCNRAPPRKHSEEKQKEIR